MAKEEGKVIVEEVLVGVLCYNHEDYLIQCLDSILNQKCNFLFKVYVFDDVSTDSSWSVIQRYKEKYGDVMIIEQPKHNTYSSGNRNAFLQHLEKVNNAKYIAFCEADDYWTDEYKLQKQYDVMQAAEDAVMCVHDVELVNVTGGHYMGIVPGYMDNEWSQEELVTRILTYRISLRINGYFIRSTALEGIDMYSDFWDYWAIDLALLVYIALKGRIIYLSEKMAAKRVNNEGSLSHQANLEKNICQQQISMFEEDIRWIDEFDRISGGRYEDLVEYHKLFRKIKLYYLYQGELGYNKYVSNANGKMYVHDFARKLNRIYIKFERKLCNDNECTFVKRSRNWMEKEWNRLQIR